MDECRPVESSALTFSFLAHYSLLLFIDRHPWGRSDDGRVGRVGRDDERMAETYKAACLLFYIVRFVGFFQA